jgi:MFS transporter, DHA1 family, multidrug resistance protein
MKFFADHGAGANNRAIVLLCSCILTATVADMLMVPYYPQFFQQLYGVTSPQYIGLLIALCRVVMLLTYPAWARLSQKVDTLQILVYTQALAGLAGVACLLATNEWLFLGFSMISVAFKSSYLLIYPLLVNLSGRGRQTQMVSLYGFMVHAATIAAAVAGGLLLDYADPFYLLVIKCVADWIQMGISWWLLKNVALTITEKETTQQNPTKRDERVSGYGIVWLVFLYYVAISLIRPYFTRFLEGLSFDLSATGQGMLFVLPAAMSMVASLCYKKLRLDEHIRPVVVLASVVVVGATWMQVAGHSLLLLIQGRICYGVALFLIQAGLDLVVFRSSQSGQMAWNYRLVTTATNAALIVAPLSLGYLLESNDLRVPFYASIGVSLLFVVSAVMVFYPAALIPVKVSRRIRLAISRNGQAG